MASKEKKTALNSANLPEIVGAIRELQGAIEKWSYVMKTFMKANHSPPIDMAIVWGKSSPSGSKQGDHKASYSLRLIFEKAGRLRELLNPSRRKAAHYNMIPEIEESDLPKATRIALRDLYAQTEDPGIWLENACADPDKWTVFLDERAKVLEPAVPPPLTDKQAATLEVLKALPKGKGLTWKEIISKLRERIPRVTVTRSVLTSHLLPVLKLHHHVKNARGVGYYIDDE